MLARLLRHIELWLSAAGVLVVWVAAALIAPDAGSVWKVAALAALAVSLLHGIIFWIVRRRQQRVREHAITEIREMMADRVKNQLAVIGMYAPLTQEREAFEMALGGINASITEIAAVVDSLSSESLVDWKQHYRAAIKNGALPAP